MAVYAMHHLSFFQWWCPFYVHDCPAFTDALSPIPYEFEAPGFFPILGAFLGTFRFVIFCHGDEWLRRGLLG